MPLIIGIEDKKMIVCNPDSQAIVGRWCSGEDVYPDRCHRCFDPETLAHYQATHYYTDRVPDPKKLGKWRIYKNGACEKCIEKLKKEGEKIYPIPSEYWNSPAYERERQNLKKILER